MWKIELLPLAVLVKSVSASGFGYKRLIFRQRILRFPLADLGCRLTVFSVRGFGLQQSAGTVFSVSGFGQQTTRFSVAYNCFALADLDCRPLVFG